MSHFNVLADFGSGYVDVPIVAPVKRNCRIHTNLKPVIDTCTLTVEDITSANLFNTTTDEIPIAVTKDLSSYFYGIVRPTFTNQIGSTLEEFKVEITDYTIRLKKTINQNLQYAGYKICNPSNTSESILHQLLYEVGFVDAELDLSEIDETIDYFVVSADEKKKYWDVLVKLLGEFGYVFYCDQDDSGKVKVYDLFPASISAAVIENKDYYAPLVIRKHELKAKAVRVTFYPHVVKNGIIVFSDTSGGDETNKCNISLGAAEYYPDGSDTADTYCDYRVDDYEVIVVNGVALDIVQTGVTTDVFTAGYKRALIQLHAATSGDITQLDITGNAVLKDTCHKNTVIKFIVAESEEIKEIEAEFITDKADADHLAYGYAKWLEYSDFTYEFGAEDLAPGDYKTLIDDTMSVETKIRVVEVIEDDLGNQKIIAEGVDEYTVTETTAEQSYNPPPVQPEYQNVAQPSQYATKEDVVSGFTGGGGTTTPTVPTISGCKGFFRGISLSWDKQTDLTNFARYEVQVSSDDSTWYSLEFDGSDWKDTLDADTDWLNEFLVHANIPLDVSGGTDDPAGVTLYYRVRRVTKAAVASAWSSSASATTTTIDTGDYGANSIQANNMAVGTLQALFAAISTLAAGYDGSGSYSSPSEGDYSLMIEDARIFLQQYLYGEWSDVNKIAMGLMVGSLLMPYFTGCGMIHGDASTDDLGVPIPTADCSVISYESDYTDQNGENAPDSTSNVELTATYKKFGSKGLGATSGNQGYIQYDDVASLTGKISRGTWYNFSAGIDFEPDLVEWLYQVDASNYIKATLRYSAIAYKLVQLEIVEYISGSPTILATHAIDISHLGSDPIEGEHYIGFGFDLENEDIFVQIDGYKSSGTFPASVSLTGAAATNYVRYYVYNNNNYYGSDYATIYLDHTLFSHAEYIAAAHFVRHYLSGVAWNTALSYADLPIKAAPGGKIPLLSPTEYYAPDSSRRSLGTVQDFLDSEVVTNVTDADTDIHAIDLSAVVEEGVRAVYLWARAQFDSATKRVEFYSDSAGSNMWFRIRPQATGVYADTYALCGLDADRKCYYKCTNASGITSLYVTVITDLG